MDYFCKSFYFNAILLLVQKAAPLIPTFKITYKLNAESTVIENLP